jgi:hypothetical protein
MRQMSTAEEGAIMTLKQTLNILKYIAASPHADYGGFDEQTIRVARAAIYQIKKLQKKVTK